MLVPIEFPSDFVVANFLKIEKTNLVPGLQRRAFAVHGIEMPINFWTILQVAISQQPEPVAQNLFGFLDRLRDY